MQRLVSVFASSFSTVEIAEYSQVLAAAPEISTQADGSQLAQWRTATVMGQETLKQIKPEADIFMFADQGMLQLACFDMDSTLIQAEVIDELAAELGIKDQVAAITERAMRGELDFKASFRERLALLNGLSSDTLDGIFNRIQIMPGADTLMATLRSKGVKTVILSGGFELFATRLAAKLGIDEVYSNVLDIVDGKLTGLAVEPIVDAEFKAQQLTKMAEEMDLASSQVLAVGDGANDLPMLAAAGIGIAFKAKPKVQELAPLTLNYGGLDGIAKALYGSV